MTQPPELLLSSGLGVRRLITLLASTALMAAGLAGCASFPEGGPSASTVIEHASPYKADGYTYVQVTPSVLRGLSSAPRATLSAGLAQSASRPDLTIGLGDLVSVTIWDFGGLLSTPTGQPAPIPPAASTAAPATGTAPLPVAANSTIPQQAVDQNGNITIPYAGTVHAAGLTTETLQSAIVHALKPVMIHPQVLVTITQNQSGFVTVAGDAARPGRVPMTLAGLRLLDVVALSGGGTGPTSDMIIRLTRRGSSRTARLEEVVENPSENIYVQADDLIVLDREPQSVVVLGATNHNAQIPFGKATLNLAEAVANGGGLTDIQSNPFGVFVFRYEPASTLHALGWASPTQNGDDRTPVVYQIDLKTPEGFLMAHEFAMQDHDIVYVANSDVVQINKILRLILTGAAIFKTSSVVAP